jgi:CHASE2 domain
VSLPASASHNGHARPGPWWANALISSLAGLFVALLVTAATVAGRDLPMFRALERVGSDIGMAYFWTFRLDEGGLSPNYVFVDVDADTCAAFQPARPKDCARDRPVSAALVVDFVRAMRASGAAVVIVDIAPFAEAADREALRDAAAGPDGPWIIAPAYGRPGPDRAHLTLTGDAARDPTRGLAAGRLRLASFVTATDPESRDGVIRQYAVFTPLDRGAGPQPVPSAPYLAAAYLNPKRAAAADCTYYRVGCAKPPSTPGQGLLPSSDKALMRPVFFTLPSLALLDPTPLPPGSEKDRLSRNRQVFLEMGYRRLSAKSLLDPRDTTPTFRTDRAAFAGHLVVLGSSLPSALDLHLTPLGQMTGSEVILNATRAFAAAQQAPASRPEGGFWPRFQDKAGGALKGSLAMTVVWLAIFFLWSHARAAGRAARFGAGVASVVVFAVGLSLVALSELSDAADNLSRSLATGKQVDVLTPVIALGLEGYVEAIKVLGQSAEQAVSRTLAATLAVTTAIGAFVRRRIMERNNAPP